MQVTIAFTTQLKAALGRTEETVELPEGKTVIDAVTDLADRYPEQFAQFVLSDGKLLPSILLSVNDQQVDADAKVKDGDTITLLSAISGG